MVGAWAVSLLFDAVPAPATRNTGYGSGCVLQFVNSNIFLHSILNTLTKRKAYYFYPIIFRLQKITGWTCAGAGSSSRLIFRLPEIKIQQQKIPIRKFFAHRLRAAPQQWAWVTHRMYRYILTLWLDKSLITVYMSISLEGKNQSITVLPAEEKTIKHYGPNVLRAQV